MGGYLSGAGLGEALSLGLAPKRDITPSLIEPEPTLRGLRMAAKMEYETSRPVSLFNSCVNPTIVALYASLLSP